MQKSPSKSKKLAQSNVILTGKKKLSSKETICYVSFYSIRHARLRSWRIFSWLVASSIKWWAWGWEIGRTNEMKLFCVRKREGGKKCHWRWETLRGCGYKEKGQEKPKLKCGFGRKTDWEGEFWNGMLYTRQCKAFGLFHKFFGKISNSNCPLESKKIFFGRNKVWIPAPRKSCVGKNNPEASSPHRSPSLYWMQKTFSCVPVSLLRNWVPFTFFLFLNS